MKLLNDNQTFLPLVEDMVYLEEQLESLRKLPKIRVNPKNKSQQAVTPAAKLYKEMLQQYTNIVRILMKASGTDEVEEDSPLREWMKNHVG